MSSTITGIFQPMNNKNMYKGLRARLGVFPLLLCSFLLLCVGSSCKKEKVGVLFMLHGGMDTNNTQSIWDSSMQQFSYDPNHPANSVIHSSAMWGIVFEQEMAKKYLLKYAFEYPRIGGADPFREISMQQMNDMTTALTRKGWLHGMTFVYDWAFWMSGDDITHFPYPRYMYVSPTGAGDNLTYCGSAADGGPWSNCDPQRYNVEGPVERLLKAGVSKIVAVDLTVGGVRFSKTFDVVKLSKVFLNKWNTEHQTSIPFLWVNDPTNLMERSFPTEPAGWTATLGAPAQDAVVPLDNSLNPVASDAELAALHVEGIEAVMPNTVLDSDTGVLLLNHAINNYNEYFDPKIDDTEVINQNIKSQLLKRRPGIKAENIVGAFMGVKEINPENGLLERTRGMRGEDLGNAWLYQSAKQKPSGEWGYFYWDALELLKNQGVKHIVIAFPQIVTTSVLDLVEVPNQIAKEIGAKNWLYWGMGNEKAYPGTGNPFADYWGNWVNTDCGGTPCCFEMGGCSDGGIYPPARQTALSSKRGDMDPSLAYDVCEYGHLGYDQSVSAPDPTKPIQDQYTGTWAMWTPPNNNPRLGKLLAKYVLLGAQDKLAQ